MRPTPTFRFFFSASSASLYIFLALGAVGDERLFHEDIQAFLDRVAEMHPAESQRRGEDGDVARLQAIHGVLVAVEADELAVVRHIHFVGVLGLQRLEAVVQARFERRRPWRRA